MSQISPADIQALHEQCRIAAKTGAKIHIPDVSVLKLHGSDCIDWFNRFCTNQVVSRKPGEGCETFVLNVKGKIISHSIVLFQENGLLLITLGQTQTSLVEHLNKYVIVEDVVIEDVTPDTKCSWVISEDFESAILKEAPTYSHVDVAQGTVVATSICGERDWLVLSSGSEGDDALSEFPELSCEAFESMRINHRFPWNGADITESNLPQEVMRDELAISFNKGCYLGQETVARIDALGHVNQFLVPLQFAAVMGEENDLNLFDGEKKAGKITSTAISPTETATIGLGYVRRSFKTAGAELKTASGSTIVVQP